MVNTQSCNCMVYLNTLTKRGLIIPTVSKAWLLFKHWQLRHKSKGVSDSRWQQNSIPPSMAANGPCGVWHLGAPMSVWCCCSQCYPRRRTDPGNAVWNGAVTFPWTQRPLLGHKGAELQAGKVQNHRDLYHFTISTTRKHSLRHTRNHTHLQTEFTQVKHDMWAKLKSNLSCLELLRIWSWRGWMLLRFLHNGKFYCITVSDSLCWSLTRTLVLVLGMLPCLCHA